MRCLHCDKSAVSRGLCMTHYQKARRAGVLALVALPFKRHRPRQPRPDASSHRATPARQRGPCDDGDDT